MSEPAEENVPSTVDRLARFMLDNFDGDDYPFGQTIDTHPELALALFTPLAKAVLEGFFRVEDATSIYAVPAVEFRSGEPRVQTHWGPMLGYLKPEEARAVGAAFLETAETAEIEASLYKWLLSSPGSDDVGAARIINSWRAYRVEQHESTPAG